MDSQSSSARIPLPLATAGIGLLLSFGFDGKIGTALPVAIGFIVGCGLVYANGVLESRAKQSSKLESAPSTVTCPACDAELGVNLIVPKSHTAGTVTSSPQSGNTGKSLSL